MKRRLVLARGLPASGKTTWAREWVQEDPRLRLRICRDDLRHMLTGRYVGLTIEQERLVTSSEQMTAATAIAAGFEPVIDATNLHLATVESWFGIAASLQADVVICSFLVGVPTCLRRNAGRPGRRVDPKVIRGMADRHYENGRLKRIPREPDVVEVDGLRLVQTFTDLQEDDLQG